jgi:catechol 2,3-dioxygenase-like lactoylglutathione lyase family enzyme
VAILASVDFVSIPPREPDRAGAFYTNTVGLRADEHARYEFWCGSTCFCIWQPERTGWKWALQKNGHLAYHVEDVAATRTELEAKGVEFAGETSDTGVCHMAFVTDPDGNDCMLHSRYAPQS